MKEKEYLASYNIKNKNISGFGDVVFHTDKKINGEILEIIRKEISEMVKNKTENEECQIVILNIVNLTDL